MARSGLSLRIHDSYIEWVKQQAANLRVSESCIMEMMIQERAQSQGDTLPPTDLPGVRVVERSD
jgi:hypothetical protein